jgi:hypothetical protein
MRVRPPCGVVGELRLGIDDRLQLIEAVDQLRDFTVLREHPPAGVVGLGALDGREATGGRLELDRANLIDRRGHLADVRTLADLAAQLRAHLLKLELQVGRELGRVKLVETLVSHGETPKFEINLETVPDNRRSDGRFRRPCGVRQMSVTWNYYFNFFGVSSSLLSSSL